MSKKNLKQVLAFTTVVILTACSKKHDAEMQKNQTAMVDNAKIYESKYDPGSAAQGMKEIRNFLTFTKYNADRQTRTTFPDISVDGGSWLAEGGANYLRNMNRGDELMGTQSYSITVQKVNPTTLSGASLTAGFNEVMGDIEAYEASSGYSANLVNGYVQTQSATEATLKFDVIFGEPWPVGSAYSYPTTDVGWCQATTELTTGITNYYTIPNTVVMGVVANPTAFEKTTNAFTNSRIWANFNSSTFLAADFATYHTGGIEVIDDYVATNYPCAGGQAQCTQPIACEYLCVFDNTQGNDFKHVIWKITTAYYTSSY
ncbi:MAG: hypothetical protein RL660_1871 [Bacteroidota bacterium]|jgi:hypothetical protein